jgi:hypothetical protein
MRSLLRLELNFEEHKKCTLNIKCVNIKGGLYMFMFVCKFETKSLYTVVSEDKKI